MKVKTENLEGPALNWAVAKCEGAVHVKEGEHAGLLHWPSPKFGPEPKWSMAAPDYCSDWAQGGPIIERELHAFDHMQSTRVCAIIKRKDLRNGGFIHGYGPTPLIAAMRCMVASKLGDEVEVPDELAV